jgi:6-pyruvoyl tetrahydropterin synthase/QueD family protein
MKIALTRAVEIAAAHFQPDYDGKCRTLHGHNYAVEVTAYGTTDALDRCGMLVDFSAMGQDLDAVVGIHDHTCLNNAYETPSVELLASDWLARLHARNPMYRRLRVHENARSTCEVWID